MSRLHLPPGAAVDRQVAMAEAQQAHLMNMHMMISAQVMGRCLNDHMNEQGMRALAKRATTAATILLEEYGIKFTVVTPSSSDS